MTMMTFFFYTANPTHVSVAFVAWRRNRLYLPVRPKRRMRSVQAGWPLLWLGAPNQNAPAASVPEEAMEFLPSWWLLSWDVSAVTK